MKKWTLIVLTGFLLLLIIIFLNGPRVDKRTNATLPDLPIDLEAYLADQEAQFSDVIPNTEKKIVWADPNHKEKTPLAIVYLHGFSATRQETAPLTDEVADALGANRFYTRLTGHGRTEVAMTDGSLAAWTADLAEAVEIGKQLGEKVVLIGASTGGTLATWGATEPTLRDHIAALILISPNFSPKNRISELLLWPWGEQIAKLIIGPERSWEPVNEGHAHYWTERYPSRAVLPVMAAIDVTRKADLSQITQPILIFYSPEDTVLNHDVTIQVFERFGSKNKKIIAITNSDDPDHHILAGDILSPSTTDLLRDHILTFLAEAGISTRNE